MELKDIKKEFANQANQYYAHGIGAYDENIIKSIFENGLRCSHNELYWTVLEFGKGSDTLFEENEELLDNWEHKGSKHIMIASLPEVFHLLDVKGTPLFQKRHAAFYNTISPEEASQLGISPGLYLKPEFIRGMYDANKKDFIENDRYYENLPEQEQKRVLDEIKQQYIETIEKSGWTLEEYAQILEDIDMEFPLTQEEISNRGQEVEQQIDMVELPNGVKVPRKQYEEEYTVEEVRTDMVELPNGIKIPRKQYEQEYATGEARADMVELPNGVKIPRRQYEQEYATGETRTDVQEQSDFEINEFGEIIRPTRAKSQEQGQQDMVTLSNGIKIPKKQYEEEQGTRKQPKGISIGEVKASVKNSKVTTQETKSATQDIKQMKEIKKLQYMQKTGQTLTPEQKLFLDEHIRQTQQAQIQFQQRKKKKKSKGKGLEM